MTVNDMIERLQMLSPDNEVYTSDGLHIEDIIETNGIAILVDEVEDSVGDDDDFDYDSDVEDGLDDVEGGE